MGDPLLLYEQLILLPDSSLIFERSPHIVPPAPIIRESPETLKVALASNLLKLNPYFISILKRIKDASPPARIQDVPECLRPGSSRDTARL